jgi:glycosyltransferase involved in cell wall biosynthesis
MRILYINHYAGSLRHGMEYRPFYLAREWTRAGHEVRIVTASYSHVRTVQPEVTNQPLREVVDGIEYIWYPTPAYSGNGFGRLWNIFSFLRQVWSQSHSLSDEFRPDVVIASSTYPMDIWVARRIARLSGAKLVHEIHDLWPLSPIELSGMSPSHPFARLCQLAEDAACRDADVVVSMLPNVAEHLGSRGLDLRKLKIVPNGIDAAEWEGQRAELPAEIAAHLEAMRSEGRTIVGYAGSHGVPNALNVVLDSAGLMTDERFAFVLVGDGMEKRALQEAVDSRKLSNVRLFPPIRKAQVRAFLESIDIAYIGWQRIPIYRFGISPNKLMDYMMARCVVLHSVEAGNDPVREAGCGLTVPPSDPSAVAQGLLRLSRLPSEDRAAMGERGRAFVLANHTYEVLADRFLKACVL